MGRAKVVALHARAVWEVPPHFVQHTAKGRGGVSCDMKNGKNDQTTCLEVGLQHLLGLRRSEMSGALCLFFSQSFSQASTPPESFISGRTLEKTARRSYLDFS